LESGEFIRVGSSKVLKTDVRIVAATNVDLKEKIAKGKFREDLYYRLNTVPIHVPSLKERKEDILILFRKFAIDFAEKYRSESVILDDDAKVLLKNYHWPGNIRELKNMAEQLSVLSQNSLVTAKDILDLIPDIRTRYLPAIQNGEKGFSGEGDFHEREILYKVLFDMKNDLNDLKSLVHDMIATNDLEVNKPADWSGSRLALPDSWAGASKANEPRELRDEDLPFIINRQEEADDAIVLEDNLSLEDMEKVMIKKALDKHNNRRKDAAKELGISERTLYRKINQYEI